MPRLVFILIALILSSVSHANSTASFSSMSCSGSLSSSLVGDASYICLGDLSVIGGNIISDSKVFLKADGMLFLDNISLNAPFIELTALNGGVSFGNGVVLTASTNLTINSGITPVTGGITQPVIINSPLLSGGSLITLTTPIPEPESYALLFAGLGLMGFMARRKKQFNT